MTSQVFANIYLNELDKYIKHILRARYYVRYADDFIILIEDKNYLVTLVPLIREFLYKQLRLDLHPGKIFFRKFSEGIDFLGYRLFPNHCAVLPKTEKRMFKKLKAHKRETNQSVMSYMGMAGHADSRKLMERVFSYFRKR